MTDKREEVRKWLVEQMKTCRNPNTLAKLAAPRFNMYNVPRWFDKMVLELLYEK